jgi:hypothetical protein
MVLWRETVVHLLYYAIEGFLRFRPGIEDRKHLGLGQLVRSQSLMELRDAFWRVCDGLLVERKRADAEMAQKLGVAGSVHGLCTEEGFGGREGDKPRGRQCSDSKDPDAWYSHIDLAGQRDADTPRSSSRLRTAPRGSSFPTLYLVAVVRLSNGPR